ncbi:MAG: SpoIIE family protein phosphatase [Planctomycetota bacterium]|jgi:sigma-B regulation protein RsbU (phosphoserine phosphatase)
MHASLRGKMILLIALPTLVIYVALLGAMMAHLRADAREEIETNWTRRAHDYAARFDGAFREAAAIAVTTARMLEAAPDLSEEQIYAQLRSNVLQNPAVYGAALAFEPGTFRPGDELVCPYVYRGPDGGDVEQMNIGREDLDWYGEEKWQWWHVPKATGRGVWTDPYFDEGAGEVLMVTFSEPFTRDGEFRGVTTVDIMLPTLRELIGEAILGDLNFVILNGAGRYVFSHQPENIMSRTVFEVARDVGRPDIAAAAERLLAGETGVISLDGWDTPERQWVFFAPIESTGWAFAARLPERDALATVRARATYASITLALTLVAIIGCIWFVSGRITRPLARLRAKVKEIADGDLDARIEGIRGRDEIAHLANTFNDMTADLRAHVDTIAAERASREKIERDLDLARDIQRGLLPKSQPELPGFDLAGWNQAADKTGGDYFDWLELGDGRTIMTLADVTGHGIGPALIVAVCRAYMRASASGESIDLGAAVSRVNDLLHEDMPDGRFVTAAVGILDPARNRMALVSAGQAPMLFYRAATGTLENWDADAMPLGIMPGMSFGDARTIAFEPGDVLVLTTDGFFEWANADGELFGTERLEAFVRDHHQLGAHDMISALHEAVLAHAAGTEQADDLTAMVIRRT